MAEQENTDGSRVKTTEIFDGDVPISGTFTPVGNTFQSFGMKSLLVWTDFTFLGSTEIQMCVHGKKTRNAAESYPLNMGYADAYGIMELRPLCFKMTDKDYEGVPISIPIGDLVPYMQILFKATGGPPVARLQKVEITMRA